MANEQKASLLLLVQTKEERRKKPNFLITREYMDKLFLEALQSVGTDFSKQKGSNSHRVLKILPLKCKGTQET